MNDYIENKTFNGYVYERDFDLALVLQLGAVLNNSVTPPRYEIQGLCDVAIPVYFDNPSNVVAKQKVPSIVIHRNDPTFSEQRWNFHGNGYYTYDQQGNAEFKRVAFPYDINYDINVLSLNRNTNLKMRHYIRQKIPPKDVVLKVIDSINTERLYEIYEVSEGDISELLDATGRIIAFTYSMRVEGELDVFTPETEQLFIDKEIDVDRM